MFVGLGPGITVMIVDVRPKPAVRQHVESCIAQGKCLECALLGIDEEAVSRGLCEKHKGQYRTAKYEQPVDQRHEFEAKAIREGKILQSRQGYRPAQENTFRKLAKDN